MFAVDSFDRMPFVGCHYRRCASAVLDNDRLFGGAGKIVKLECSVLYSAAQANDASRLKTKSNAINYLCVGRNHISAIEAVGDYVFLFLIGGIRLYACIVRNGTRLNRMDLLLGTQEAMQVANTVSKCRAEKWA